MPESPLPLVLASTSPARLATLRAAGIEPIVIPSEVDEEGAVRAAEAAAGSALPPAELVVLLARLKAEAVARPAPIGAARLPTTALVLGGDSLFELDGRPYGKPHQVDVAVARWRMQRGRSGTLHSGHWLIELRDGEIVGAVGGATSAVVHFAADLGDAEIDAYVATGEPLRVAGAFTIDARGGAYIDRIEGDPHTVVGLSLPELRRLVRSLGHEWHELWNHS